MLRRWKKWGRPDSEDSPPFEHLGTIDEIEPPQEQELRSGPKRKRTREKVRDYVIGGASVEGARRGLGFAWDTVKDWLSAP